MRLPLPTPLLFRVFLTGSLLAAVGGASAASAITGICPDGSMFIVKSTRDIPCPEAKQVESQDLPPIRPELMPRPYLWDVYRKRADQNNPYNLIDRADKVRGLGEPEAAAERPLASRMPAGPPGLPSVSSAPPQPAAAPPPAEQLALTDGELRDLFLLVELSQEFAPATFLDADDQGGERLRVSFARSDAFQNRIAELTDADGEVLLFFAHPKAMATFHPNFTFVQGQRAFHPDPADETEIALLQGRVGDLGSDELALGYVVLPGTTDLARPLDIYWNDRQLEVTFHQ